MPELKDYVDLLMQLVAIPSFSRDEGAACDCLWNWLEAHSVDRIGRQKPIRRVANNIILEQEEDGTPRPVIMLNAHIDTVKPAASYTRDPFKASLEGDFLYGLGTNDDGGSLVALIAAYLELVQREQSYRLIFTATTEEEVCGSQGIELILPQLGAISLGVIGEPTGMQMAVAERGLMVLDCTARGRSGHAARGEGINAIYEALPDIEWFRSHKFSRVSEYLGPVKMTVTMINSGTQHNVVPDSCTFVVDVRPNGMYTNQEILQLITGVVSCEVRARSTRLGSSSIPASHPVVQRGLAMGLSSYGSPTCSNQTLCNFTTIKIGPGDSARSHTADEYIRVSEISDGISRYVTLLDRLDL